MRVGGIAFAMVTLAFAQAGAVLALEGSAPLDARRGGPRRRLHEAAEGVRRHPQHEEPLLARARVPRGRLLRRPLGGRVVAGPRVAGDPRERAAGRGARHAAEPVQAAGVRALVDAGRRRRRSSTCCSYNGSTLAVTAPNFTLTLLLMVVIGGAGSRWGAVLGGILYTYLNDRLVAVGSSSTRGGSAACAPHAAAAAALPARRDLHPHRLLPSGRPRRDRDARAAQRAAPAAGFHPARPHTHRTPGGRMTLSAGNDGVTLAYEEQGEGEPLLFVQGLGYDRHGFGPLPGLLAERLPRARLRQPRHRRQRRAGGAVLGADDGGRRDRGARRCRRSRARTCSA